MLLPINLRFLILFYSEVYGLDQADMLLCRHWLDFFFFHAQGPWIYRPTLIIALLVGTDLVDCPRGV